MLKNHKFLEARYIDEGHHHVSTLWEDKDKNIVEEVIQADPNQWQWKELMKLTTMEDILKETAEWKRGQSKAFNQLVEKRAYELAHKLVPESSSGSFTTEIIELNKDADTLFKTKLNLMELESVKNSTAAFKKKLRKAKSLLECFSMVNEVHKD